MADGVDPGAGRQHAAQRPARLDEPLTARVRIVRLRADKDLVNLASVVTGADGRVVVQGESLVLVRNLADKGADRAA